MSRHSEELWLVCSSIRILPLHSTVRPSPVSCWTCGVLRWVGINNSGDLAGHVQGLPAIYNSATSSWIKVQLPAGTTGRRVRLTGQQIEAAARQQGFSEMAVQ